MGDSPVDVGEAKDWRTSCDVSEATEGTTEGLANEALLILQPFRRAFTYVTDNSLTSPGEPPMD